MKDIPQVSAYPADQWVTEQFDSKVLSYRLGLRLTDWGSKKT